MAQVESASSTPWKAASPSSHQNECSTAMARSNRRPASGAGDRKGDLAQLAELVSVGRVIVVLVN